ncbi:B3 DNA binding domain [Macleaya cordata]|uniref:B3 DNA binding domain n=1 Tax=Macleaya cordata TaxID=56857 RepID=A0A200Q3Y4_MACCD|nr:B3 DNA binding domain [Macleaya cordata]
MQGKGSNTRGTEEEEEEGVGQYQHQHQYQHHDDVIWSSLPEEKRPLFFKIIHSAIIRDQQLGIPIKFVRKIGKDLSDVAVLKVPTGATWKVELIKKPNGGVWFQNGLQEFIECHSISPGHFLVFRYDGNSQFYVLIFDMSGSEIDYHLSSSISSDHSDEESNQSLGSLDTEEFADDIEEDYMEISNGDDSSSGEEEEEEEEEEGGLSIGEPVAKKSANKKGTGRKKRSETTLVNFVRGTQIANEFKSKYPFFAITLQPAYVNHKYMPIPCTFDRRYLPENLEHVRLKISDGRSWVVGLLCSEKKEIRLSKGLSAFIHSNNLEEGDVCVFEVVKKRYLVLRVHIFRRDIVDHAMPSSNPQDGMLTNENSK